MKEFAPELFALIPDPLLQWFDTEKRTLPWRGDTDPYHVWLSEIMLQQTRVEAVKPYFERFLRALPDIRSLAAANDETILKLWEGLGYYSRVRNLRAAAQIIVEHHHGVFPSDIRDIRALPGIGDYTAGAIASIVFGKAEPAVDGNVLRVTARLAGSREDVTKTAVRRAVTEGLRKVYPANRASAFTQSLMELGALVCVPNGAPKCLLCPLNFFCASRKYDLANIIPFKPAKKPRRREDRTVLLLRCEEKYALRKRPETGLLASLWEFPCLEGVCGMKDVKAAYPAILQWEEGPSAVHLFSHIEWHMRSYFGKSADELPEFQWFLPEELPAVPSAFKVYVQKITNKKTKKSKIPREKGAGVNKINKN